MNKIIANIRAELSEKTSEETLLSIKRFFKESIQSYGVKNGEVEKIAKQHFQEIRALSKSDVFEISEELWQSNFIEEAFVACHFIQQKKKEFEAKDIDIFERWILLYINNWATCDTFCNHSMGDLLQKFPELSYRTLLWTQNESRWLKRASAVSYIVPAKKGLFLDIVFETANLLLVDSDDMVQKGYGWMLKVASQANEDKIFNYVMQNKKIMPRIALRYSIEKMTSEHRLLAMKK